jgi:hypothetical protein
MPWHTQDRSLVGGDGEWISEAEVLAESEA